MKKDWGIAFQVENTKYLRSNSSYRERRDAYIGPNVFEPYKRKKKGNPNEEFSFNN